MDSKKSNKIRDIVRLQQILKKWRKTANASKHNHHNTTTTTTTSSGGGNKGIKFLKKTLSFSDSSVPSSSSYSTSDYVPKGYLAVCVGKELKRYVIPTEYLGHQAFGILLREAEEEFGFHQEGVLKIPCEISIFERILKFVQGKREDELYFHEFVGCFDYNSTDFDGITSNTLSGCCSPDCEQLLQPSLPQLCR